jgi:hypothetical protein
MKALADNSAAQLKELLVGRTAIPFHEVVLSNAVVVQVAHRVREYRCVACENHLGVLGHVGRLRGTIGSILAGSP